MDFFLFEESFKTTLDFIPLKIRYFLDKTKLKLSLDQWRKLSLQDRLKLLSLTHLNESTSFYEKIISLCLDNKIEETIESIEQEKVEPFFIKDFHLLSPLIIERLKENTIEDPIWNACSDFEKYALIKLSSKKEVSKDLPSLAKELRSKKMLDVEEAYKIILKNLPDLIQHQCDVESSPILYLAEDILSDRDYPSFDRVMMDGVAIDSQDVEMEKDSNSIFEFKITHFSGAGEISLEKKGIQTAIEVSTGSVLPKKMNTVIAYEQITIKDGIAFIPAAAIKDNLNVAKKGEDSLKGEILIKKRQFLKPQHYPILASVGKSSIACLKFPRVFIISTGNELVSVDDKNIAEHQTRNSHAFMIKSFLKRIGFSEINSILIPDDPLKIKSCFLEALKENDIIFFTGGVSMGKKDFVKQVLIESEAEILFHKILQKPGKPLLFAKKDKTLIMGLPGNPLSAAVCLRRYFMEAFLEKLLDRPTFSEMNMDCDVRKQRGLTFFRSVKQKETCLVEVMNNTSGDFVRMGESDGIIEVEKEKEIHPKEEKVRYYSWVVKL